MNIDHNSHIYLQLSKLIKEKIENLEYLPGMPIPSENELAQKYDINRLTVRNAITLLVKEGLLKRIQGKGVYVVGEKIDRDLEKLGGFSQTMIQKNAKPATKILIKTIREAGIKFSKIFNISKEDKIYYIKRICYANDNPISLEEIFIPHYVLPKLEGIDLSIFSIYEIYGFYRINIKHALQTLSLVRLEAKDARMLQIPNTNAVMLFECFTYDDKEKVIEFSRTYTRSDKCRFSVHFKK
mgnify:CR=1 FL=1